MSDIWGFCAGCDRWFACPGGLGLHAPQHRCPACGDEPRVIRSREQAVADVDLTEGDAAADVRSGAVARDPEPQPEIWGRCPRCCSWFAAHEWFNPDVPLPCCPRCGLSPERLRYDTPPAQQRATQPSSERWLG